MLSLRRLYYQTGKEMDISIALNYLHVLGVMHCNLKPSKVLLESYNTQASPCARLSLFGSTKDKILFQEHSGSDFLVLIKLISS